MKKIFAILIVIMFFMQVAEAAGIRSNMISVRPTYTPSIGNPVPRQTVVGRSVPLGRNLGGYYPVYGGYYSGVRYRNKREQVAVNVSTPATQQVVHVNTAPPITSCNGITYYDNAGNITRCR